jgi:hypothetical protein
MFVPVAKPLTLHLPLPSWLIRLILKALIKRDGRQWAVYSHKGKGNLIGRTREPNNMRISMLLQPKLRASVASRPIHSPLGDTTKPSWSNIVTCIWGNVTNNCGFWIWWLRLFDVCITITHSYTSSHIQLLLDNDFLTVVCILHLWSGILSYSRYHC